MIRFTFFRNNRPKQFDYVPMYYDKNREKSHAGVNCPHHRKNCSKNVWFRSLTSDTIKDHAGRKNLPKQGNWVKQFLIALALTLVAYYLFNLNG